MDQGFKIVDRQYWKKTIPEVVRRLLAFENIHRIIVFGSVATDSQSLDSDLDLLIVKDANVNKYQDIVQFRKVLKGLGLPIDILVIEKNEFQERLEYPSNVYYWANKNGKVVYAAI